MSEISRGARPREGYNNIAMQERTFIGIGIAALALILLYFLFLVVQRLLRSRLVSKDTADLAPAFTLDEIKRMLENGQINKDEFESIKKTIIDNVRTSDDAKGR
jgi:hypothetical protein